MKLCDSEGNNGNGEENAGGRPMNREHFQISGCINNKSKVKCYKCKRVVNVPGIYRESKSFIIFEIEFS